MVQTCKRVDCDLYNAKCTRCGTIEAQSGTGTWHYHSKGIELCPKCTYLCPGCYTLAERLQRIRLPGG